MRAATSIGGDVLCSDVAGWNSGAAQGGIVQDCKGNWFAVLFQDHGALGRIPVLIPVRFENDFPVFGIEGKVPDMVQVYDNRPDYKYRPLFCNDFTDTAWQWNHIPDKSLVSISTSELVIKTGKTCVNVVQAANTLTQRAFTEHCSGTVTVDAPVLNEGDFAGLCALEGEYGFIGITKKDGGMRLVVAEHKIPYSPWAMDVFDSDSATIIAEKELSSAKLALKASFSLEHEKEQVQFSYFDENQNTFQDFAQPVKLRYTLDHFTGVRFALFMYSTENAGGSTTFKDFKIELL